MSDNRLGREAHHETSNLSLEKTTDSQLQLNTTQYPTVSEHDLEKANGSTNNDTTTPLQDSPTISTKSDAAAGTQPEITYPEGGLQAWLVVLGSFSGMLASFGLMNVSDSLSSQPLNGRC